MIVGIVKVKFKAERNSRVPFTVKPIHNGQARLRKKVAVRSS